MRQLHKTFGHRNFRSIARLAKQQGWHIDPNETQSFCDICSKSKRRVAKSAKHKTSATLEGPGIIVSTDYIGKFDDGVGGVTGAFIFIDNYSKHPLSYTVKHKSEFLQCFKQYLIDSGLRINDKINGPQILQSDTTNDVFSTDVKDFCTEHGIRQRCSPPYTQSQNGIAERAIQTIKNTMRTILLDSGLPNKMWPYALSHACLLLSVLPNSSTDTSPFQLQYGSPPTLDATNIAPFGERCIIPDYANNSKSDFTHSPNIQGLYLGYSRRSKSMFIWICGTKRIRESNNVTFPFLTPGPHPSAQGWTTPSKKYSPELDDLDPTVDDEPTNKQESFVEYVISENDSAFHIDDMDYHTANAIDSYHDPTVDNPLTSTPNNTSSTEPVVLNDTDFLVGLTPEPMESAPALTTPNQRGMTSRFLALVTSLIVADSHEDPYHDCTTFDDPINFALSTVVKYEDYTQATKDPLWKTWYEPAHNKEMQSLEERGVFTRMKKTDVPKGCNIVKSKVIYAQKYASDGSMTKAKMRLCAKGYSQRWGVDFFESFAPTPMHSVFRILMIIALKFNMVIKQYDVSTAFLHGELNEDIYMEFPRGMQEYDSDGNLLVVKLNYGLYGLKQGSRCWNTTFDKSLKNLGYTRSSYEPCLYIKDGTYIYLYVDDLIVISPDTKRVDELYKQLSKEYNLTGGEDIESFLGVHIERSTDGKSMTLSQKALIEQLADQFPTIKGSRPVKQPMVSDAQFYKADCVQPTDDKYDAKLHTQYRSILGTLLYVCGKTRPDISYSLSKASTVMSAPSQKHMDLLWHIFRYVFHTRAMKMTVKPDNNPNVNHDGYSDSDWARDLSTRKSTTGICTKINGCIVSSSSKTQAGIVHSTGEAELVAATTTCKDIVHQRRILAELGFPQTSPTILYCDSTSAINISNNPMIGSRLRHVQISDFWVRELVDRQIVKLSKISGEHNVADVFTKPLTGTPFYEYRAELGIQ
jgi:hypothetical protein